MSRGASYLCWGRPMPEAPGKGRQQQLARAAPASGPGCGSARPTGKSLLRPAHPGFQAGHRGHQNGAPAWSPAEYLHTDKPSPVYGVGVSEPNTHALRHQLHPQPCLILEAASAPNSSLDLFFYLFDALISGLCNGVRKNNLQRTEWFRAPTARSKAQSRC